MPRIARGETAGGIYHIINRGNMQMQVFDESEDYNYFLDFEKEVRRRDTRLLPDAQSLPPATGTYGRKKSEPVYAVGDDIACAVLP